MKEYILLLETESRTHKTKAIEAESLSQARAIGRAYAVDYKMQLREIWELVFRA